MHEAMTTGHIARIDAKNLCRNYAAAEQHDNPVNRSNEFFATRSPAHFLGNGQAGQSLGDDLRNQGSCVTALHNAAEDQLQDAVFFGTFELVDGHAARASEPSRGRSRVSVLVKSRCNSGAGFFHALVWLRRDEAPGTYCQPARSRKTFNGIETKPCAFKRCTGVGKKRFGQKPQRLRRELSCAYLYQKIMFCHGVL